MLRRNLKRAQLGVLYILGLDRSGRKEEAEKEIEKDVSGQTLKHIIMNALIQIALIVAFVFQCHHEKFPKMVSPPPYPKLGEAGGPVVQEAVPVIPFKRYPPGFDVWGPQSDGTASDRLSEPVLEKPYKFFVEIATYVYIGFALQYSFLRKFGYSTLSFGLLQATVAAQWGIIWMQMIDRFHCDFLLSSIGGGGPLSDQPCVPNFPAAAITGSFSQIQYRQACSCRNWNEVSANRTKYTELPWQSRHTLLTIGKMNFDDTIVMSYPAMMEGLYATVPVQVTYGMMLGKVGPTQLMIGAIMCVLSYGLNYWICMYILGAWDHTGGSCIIHIFGSCFAMGCTILASPKGASQNPDNAPRYNADVLCIVGVILNWMTFPSFNCYFAPSAAQQAVVVNTYLALFSSCISAMIFSSLYSGQFKLDPADIQRSSLAGGVAVSSVANIFLLPWEAMVLGFMGGAACSTCHHFLRRWLETKLMITDTVGVVSLHFIPATIAWIAGIIKIAPYGQPERGGWSGVEAAAAQTKTLPFSMEYSEIFMHSQGTGDTAQYQAFLMPLCVVMGLGTGFVTGAMMKKIKGPSVARTFSDSIFWKVPEDFKLTEDIQKSDERAKQLKLAKKRKEERMLQGGV